MKYKILRKNIQLFIFYLFLIIPFFRIPYFNEQYLKLNDFYNLWLYISSFIIFILIILKKSFSKIILYLCLFLGCLIFSSFFNNDGIKYCIQNIPEILFFCLLIDYGLKKDKIIFLKTLASFFTVLVYLNLFLILLFPQGMYTSSTGFFENWLLGYKNTHILYIFPGILFRFLYSYCKYNKVRISDYVYLSVGTISTLIVKNSTGIVGIVCIWLFFLLKKIFNKIHIFNILTYFLINVGLFVSIVVWRVQEIFSYLIIHILHRNITFTGRTFIWDSALKYIKRKPILGYGNVSFNYNNYIFSTHNTILGILHKVGFVGIFFYFLFLYKSLKELWKNKANEISQFISIIIFSYFLMMLVEAYGFAYYLFIFVIAYDITIIIKGGVYENNITC